MIIKHSYRPRMLVWLPWLTLLSGCSSVCPLPSVPVQPPRIPAPPAALMTPEPTGSEVLQRAQQTMSSWLPTTPAEPTK